MNDWKMVLLTSVISAIVAMLTGWVTSKFAYKSEVKKYLYSKRELLYYELYEYLDKFLMDMTLVYDSEFKKNLYDFKPKVKLVGSKSVIKGFKDILAMINQFNSNLNDFQSKNNPECNISNYEYQTDENGEEQEIFHWNEYDSNRYKSLEKEFINDNLPESQKVSTLINDIVNAMRCDLGNSNIRW